MIERRDSKNKGLLIIIFIKTFSTHFYLLVIVSLSYSGILSLSLRNNLILTVTNNALLKTAFISGIEAMMNALKGTPWDAFSVTGGADDIESFRK